MAATASQIKQFDGLLASGNYQAAADLARSAGYSDKDIASYVGAGTSGISTQQASDYLSSYKTPAGVATVVNPSGPMPSGSVSGPTNTPASSAKQAANPSPSGSTSTAATQPATTYKPPATVSETPNGLLTYKPPSATTTPTLGTKLSSYLPSIQSGESMDDAYYRYWQQNVQQKGDPTTYESWMSGIIGNDNPYAASLKSVGSAYDAYRSGQYATAADEQAAWNNLVAASGMPGDQFQNMYGQYFQRADVTTPRQSTPSGTAGTESLTSIPTQSVSDRAADLMADDGLLMQAARTQALQEANARGLLNSSIAVGAAQNAVLKQSESLANADANYAQASNEFNANWANDMVKLGQQFKYGMEELRQTFANNMAMQQYLNGFEATQNGLQRQLQLTLQEMQSGATTQNQTSADKVAALTKATELMVDTQKYIADITASQELDDASKNVLITQQINAANMAVKGYSRIYGDDLSEILNFDSLRPRTTTMGGSAAVTTAPAAETSPADATP